MELIERYPTSERFAWFAENSHPNQRHCVGCGLDASEEGVDKVCYTYEPCDCVVPEWLHLAERVWHRPCFTEYHLDKEEVL